MYLEWSDTEDKQLSGFSRKVPPALHFTLFDGFLYSQDLSLFLYLKNKKPKPCIIL